MKKYVLSALFISQLLFAKSNTEKIGDFLTFAIPASAYASTWYFESIDGDIDSIVIDLLTFYTPNLIT